MGLCRAPELQRQPGSQEPLGAESGDSPAHKGCQGPGSAHPAPRSQPGFSGLLECWCGLSQPWFSEAPLGFPAPGKQPDRQKGPQEPPFHTRAFRGSEIWGTFKNLEMSPRNLGVRGGAPKVPPLASHAPTP